MDVTYLSAFFGGLVSFVTPCVLPMVPVYIASICGPDVFEKKEGRNRLAIFMHSLLFVLGFSVVFILLGVAGGLLGFAIAPHLADFRVISGSVLIFFGLFMLVSLKVPFLNFEKRMESSSGKATGYLRSFITGAVFTVAWTPCVAPILASILTLAAASATASTGAILLSLYSLGLGIPFLAIGALLDTLLPVIRKMNRYSTYVYIVGGLLLLTFGILIILNNVNVLARAWYFWVSWVAGVTILIYLAKRFKWVTI
jgi:cytochrome c-type biogenesis protein